MAFRDNLLIEVAKFLVNYFGFFSSLFRFACFINKAEINFGWNTSLNCFTCLMSSNTCRYSANMMVVEQSEEKLHKKRVINVTEPQIQILGIKVIYTRLRHWTKYKFWRECLDLADLKTKQRTKRECLLWGDLSKDLNTYQVRNRRNGKQNVSFSKNSSWRLHRISLHRLFKNN